MIQVLYGGEDHKRRATALVACTPGASLASASGPALDKKIMKIHTLCFWGHGTAHDFCGLTSMDFVSKVKEWQKWNPTIKTVEIITCNARHGTEWSEKDAAGVPQVRWVKSYTDQVKPGLKKLGLTIKALPMGMGAFGANSWSILKFHPTSQTWLYVTADGTNDNEKLMPAVAKVEHHPLFLSSKNYAIAGAAVKASEPLRTFTLDYGNLSELRAALVQLA